MPGLTGAATYERMRVIAPNLPVVLSSGRERDDMLVTSMTAAMDPETSGEGSESSTDASTRS